MIMIVSNDYVPLTIRRARTWRARLLTLPWKPWEAFEVISNPIYIVDGTVFCHPETASLISQSPGLHDRIYSMCLRLQHKSVSDN